MSVLCKDKISSLSTYYWLSNKVATYVLIQRCAYLKIMFCTAPLEMHHGIPLK
jgi:hypothetical protein